MSSCLSLICGLAISYFVSDLNMTLIWNPNIDLKQNYLAIDGYREIFLLENAEYALVPFALDGKYLVSFYGDGKVTTKKRHLIYVRQVK